MEPYQLIRGHAPLLISVPHNSAMLPDALQPAMTEIGRSSIDTDWFLDRLYGFAPELGASFLLPAYSRYAIDLNRPASSESLYPGRTTTGLFPIESFAGEPLFNGPRDEEQDHTLLNTLWRPYHDAITTELARLREIHQQIVLFEAHSIASHVPRLFDGQLPDFCFGTNHGKTCNPGLEQSLVKLAEQASDYVHVFNGRFVGGYITRAYGDPAQGVHAVQLELSQATYMDEESKSWSDQKAQQVQPVLHSIITALLEWAHAHSDQT